MSFKLPIDERKADYVLGQFDRIAKRYDFTNDVISLGMHRSWKQRAVQTLCSNPSGKYLDVCCGTGDLALMIAKQLNANGSVVGLDFSSNMLQIASRRSQTKQHLKDSIMWTQGDAQKLPFPDSSFDGAIISFGLRNLTDLQKGLSELARVVKVGGQVINLDLGRSELPFFSSMFFIYFRYLVPIVGYILQQDREAYTYLPESLKNYPKPEGISRLFQQAGLTVTYYPLALGTVAMHVGIKSGGY